MDQGNHFRQTFRDANIFFCTVYCLYCILFQSVKCTTQSKTGTVYSRSLAQDNISFKSFSDNKTFAYIFGETSLRGAPKELPCRWRWYFIPTELKPISNESS